MTSAMPPTEASQLSPHCLAGVLVPIENIQPSTTNPRKHFDEAKLAELAASIKAHGVLQPILVRPTYRLTTGSNSVVSQATFWERPEAWPVFYELVAGERRFRAAQAAGIDRIPATVRDLTDKEVLEIQVIENEQRDDLGPLEKARGYQVLVHDHGYAVDDLAAKIGKSPATIYGLLKLLDLPEKARKAVAAGELAMSTAQLIARVPNERARKELADTATRKGWDGNLPSYRQIKDTIQRDCMVELKQAPFSQKDETLLPAAGSCQACPKRTGNDKVNFPEARADVCTDPLCYRTKLQAHAERALKLAKEEGTKVLEGKEAEKALGHASGFYDLADQCHSHPKSKSYKQLVGADLKDQVVVAVDTRGETHRLVPRAAANKVLKDKHKIHFGSYSSHGNDSYARAQAKRAREAKLRSKAGTEALAEIVAKAERDAEAGSFLDRRAWLEQLVHCAAGEIWHETRRHVLRRRGHDPKDFAKNERLFKQLASGLEPAQQLGLLVEILLTRSLTQGGPYSNSRQTAEVCQTFGIDFKAIEKRLRDKDKSGKKGSRKSETEASAPKKPLTPAKRQRPEAPAKDDPEEDEDLGTLTGITVVPLEQALEQESDEDARASFLARHPGEPAEVLGLALADLDRASIVEKFAKPHKKPAPCQPFELDGRKWCTTGSVHSMGMSSFECTPLYTQADFRAKFKSSGRLNPDFPGPEDRGAYADARRENCYFGTQVSVRGEVHVIGPVDEERRLVCGDQSANGQASKQPSLRQAGKAMAKAGQCCRVCGCTDTDCRQCIEKKGEPCTWVEENLCSACADEEDETIAAEMNAEPAPTETNGHPAETKQKFYAWEMEVSKHGSADRETVTYVAATPAQAKRKAFLIPQACGVEIVRGLTEEEYRRHVQAGGVQRKQRRGVKPGRLLPNPDGAATIQEAAAAAADPVVRARLNRMAGDLRGDDNPDLLPLRDLPFTTRAKESAISALERFGVITVKDARERMLELGTDMAAALHTIPGVGKPSATQLAKEIEDLLCPTGRTEVPPS